MPISENLNLMEMVAILITSTAAFSYFNLRVLKLPPTIGLMAVSGGFSLLLVILEKLGFNIRAEAMAVMGRVDFNETLMNVMLSFMLFAGSLHVKFSELRANWGPIVALATLGVLISTLTVGLLIHLTGSWMGISIPLPFAFLFGALISPTDPIAVLGILKKAGAPKNLETQIVGESLFNDGIGVVVFFALLGIATQYGSGAATISWGQVGHLFMHEALGGLGFGLALGYLAYLVLRSIDDYKVEILITIALVVGGAAVASRIHVSAPLAMVVAGLFIGNQGRAKAMSTTTTARLDDFWELVDEILNALLFVLIGLELIVITFSTRDFLLGLIAIPIVLVARFVSVSIPVTALAKRWSFSPRSRLIMTWGGLRGGISIALALQVPNLLIRDHLLVVTYCVVVFSILVQGLTIKKLVVQEQES